MKVYQSKLESAKLNRERPTVVFATVCKNEEEVIEGTLKSVAPHVDYIVFVDTGSEDRTVEIVKDFMVKNKINGEIHVDEWVGFDHNKTLMMQYAKDKADYIFHVDSHMHLQGDFKLTWSENMFDVYDIEQRRGGSVFNASILFKGDLDWRFIGVRHTIIRCDSRTDGGYNQSYLGDCWIQHGAGGMGKRSSNPDKYKGDALALTDQFWRCVVSDPDGIRNRSAFYTAQSWFDYGDFEKARQWYNLYLALNDTWIEERFESLMKIAMCTMAIEPEQSQRIVDEMEGAIQLFPDRAEPLMRLGRYLNSVGIHDLAYKYLKEASEKRIEDVKQKYSLFIDDTCYGIYLNDELSVACYWTQRYREGIELIEQILADDRWSGSERIKDNLKHFINRLEEIEEVSVDI